MSKRYPTGLSYESSDERYRNEQYTDARKRAQEPDPWRDEARLPPPKYHYGVPRDALYLLMQDLGRQAMQADLEGKYELAKALQRVINKLRPMVRAAREAERRAMGI